MSNVREAFGFVQGGRVRTGGGLQTRGPLLLLAQQEKVGEGFESCEFVEMRGK